jgi:hypothetical protein
MNILRLIVLFSLLFSFSCNNNSQSSIQTVSPPKFILDFNELRILKDDTCDKQIDTDSLNTITQFDSIKYNYRQGKNNFNKTICLSFNFLGYIQGQAQKVTVQLIPRKYGVVASTIPTHSFLWVEIADSNTISTITGNEHYFDGHESSDSLSNYVKRLFLNKPDTTRYGQKFVNLFFPTNSFHFVDKYLTQIVIGYLKAQRELCKVRFGKNLKEVTLEEIGELKATTPLVFKISLNKNHS